MSQSLLSCDGFTRKTKALIYEENYNALEVIYNAELAKLSKWAIILKKILLAEDLSASSNIPKNDTCVCVMSDKRVIAARYNSIYHFHSKVCSLAP